MSEILSEKNIIDEYLKNVDSITFLNSDEKKILKEKFFEFQKNDNLPDKVKIGKDIWDILIESSLRSIANNLEGLDELKEYYNKYIEFEEILYGLDPYYREHTLHVIWVYLLGDYHIRKSMKYDGIELTLREITKETLESFKPKVEPTWCFIALTHDLGYPIERISNFNEVIKRSLSVLDHIKYQRPIITFSKIEEELIDYLIKIISTILLEEGDNREWRITFIYPDSSICRMHKEIGHLDHGLMSGFILMKLIHLFYKIKFSSSNDIHINGSIADGDSHEYSLIETIIPYEILKAVCHHNINYAEYFKYNTLDFLLKIFDEMEEFSRYTRAGKLRAFKTEYCKVKVVSFKKDLIHIEYDYRGSTLYEEDIKRNIKRKCLMYNKNIEFKNISNIILHIDYLTKDEIIRYKNEKGNVEIQSEIIENKEKNIGEN